MCKDETENDFIQIDISDEDRDILALAYMENNFSDATKKLFKFNKAAGMSLQECLYFSLVNETANVALQNHVDRQNQLNDGYTNDE